MEPVLVTAFIHQNNHYQDLNFYITNGKRLLETDFRKIIFMSKHIIPHFENLRSKNNVFVEYDIENMYLHNYLDKLDHNTSGNSNKDTNTFFAIMCNKTEFIRKAIEDNVFKTDHYFWIDFGIYKIFKENLCIENLKKHYNNVRIGNIWDLHTKNNTNLFQQISWYFAGGVFGGHKTKLLRFADMMKKETLEFIENNNYLLWEVNLWYILYLKEPELFSPYKCDHNNTIVNNY